MCFSNKTFIYQGFADEAVVIVKLQACEGMETCQRIKLAVRDMDVGGEGWNMLSVFQ